MRLILLILLSVCYADVIHVPADYSTIQEGIDASIGGDTVLVDQGIYYENLILDKSITLTSNAIYDDLTEWYEYSTTFSQYELTNDNIANTVINGSDATNGEIFQSVILINGADCITPLIFGFTIKGGSGTQTEEVIETPEGNEETVIRLRGGGILSNNALPEMHYNYILDNQNIEDDLYAGGGMNTGTGIDFPENELGILNSNTRCDGDIDLSHNFYRENESLFGNTLATTDFNGFIDMSESIFDVYDCPDEEVTEVWVDIDEEVEITFEDGVGDLCSIVEDVWVSPDGDDYLNTGVSENNAFKTINYALAVIAPDDDNAITINLTEGTFSPSTTGETFPIIMISNVNLIGQGEEVTILDAEETDRVITIENCNNNTISDLTVTGGISINCAGISVYGSIQSFHNLIVKNNYAERIGGGLCIGGTNTNLNNLTIIDNTAGGWESEGGGGIAVYGDSISIDNSFISNNISSGGYGGGLYIDESNISISNTAINNNEATAGGGIHNFYSDVNLSNVTIKNNSTFWFGGGISALGPANYQFNTDSLCNIYSNQSLIGQDIGASYFVDINNNPLTMNVYLDTFSVLMPTEYYANPIEQINIAQINHGIISNQVSADLYVSNNGNDNNSGLSFNDALLTIDKANQIIFPTDNNPLTIHLDIGEFDITSGINILSNTKLKGIGVNQTHLYGFIMMLGNKNTGLNNLKFTGQISGFGFTDLNINEVLLLGYSYPFIFGHTHSTITIINSTIKGLNLDNNTDPIITINAGSKLRLINSILWNENQLEIQLGDSPADDPDDTIPTYNELLIVNSVIMDGELGILNESEFNNIYIDALINADPLFTNPDNGNFTLQPDSPCIDNGTTYYEIDGEVILNMDESEYYGAAPDMGAYEFEPLEVEEAFIPADYQFNPVYPNPFNPTTTISFSIPEPAHTTITAYTLMGRKLETLTNEVLNAGYHTINWNASYYPSGVYLIRMESGSFTQTQKVVLVK